MSRWLCVCILAAIATAEDPNEIARRAAAAIETKLTVADELRRQGKTDAALQVYKEAVRLHDSALEKLKGVEVATPEPQIDPPADLAHLDGTTDERRRQIDRLVALLLDPKGQESARDARRELIEIGKAAFPRILGAMAQIRDGLTDDNGEEERRIEVALARGDACLRAMDGYLDSKKKNRLRPGVEKDYVAYVLRLHYRRWNESLKDLAVMPGAHTPPADPKPAAAPKRRPGTGRWDPPATLGHLENTPAEQRKQIDALVKTMLDVQAGRGSLDARQELAAIGKPAFPVILGAMAGIRDKITDNDSMDERLLESSLKLADECLREMDGYLTSKEKQPIRPGTDRKYIQYILRLHYRRWTETLQQMAAMPGPYKDE